MIELKRASVRQWAQLLLGLAFYGIAITLMLRSGLGLGPWDMLHQGVSRLSGLSVGVASELVGVVLVVALMLIFRARFGLGTVANVIFIGVVTDLTMPLVMEAQGLFMQLLYYAIAIPVCGLGSGLYIGARMGAGPRDTLMMTLSQRTGRSVRLMRTVIELVVLVAGWLMGGQAGLGTVLFALGIGPAVQWGMRVARAQPHHAPPQPTPQPTNA